MGPVIVFAPLTLWSHHYSTDLVHRFEVETGGMLNCPGLTITIYSLFSQFEATLNTQQRRYKIIMFFSEPLVLVWILNVLSESGSGHNRQITDSCQYHYKFQRLRLT